MQVLAALLFLLGVFRVAGTTNALFGVATLGAVLVALAPPAIGAAQTQSGSQPPSPATPNAPDLTLGGGAGTVLVGLTVRPAQPGANTLLVYVLPGEGPVNPADVSVHLVVNGQSLPLEFCSRSCRTADVNLAGGEHVDLIVDGPSGGTAGFDLPTLPAPDGAGLLDQIQDRMHALRTYRMDEVVGPVTTFGESSYTFQAPDRMQVYLGVSQTIFVGPTRYTLDDPSGPWRVDNLTAGITVPRFNWDLNGPDDAISAARVVGTENVDGVPTQALAFFKGVYGTPFWFRLLVDADGLVRRAEMNGQGHFMVDHFTDFDAPLSVEPPALQ